uniref:Uncharacterized protein n=1 Tax=Anguilla anguilla TaxID=7936 RepID=A0A0E9W0Y1_ANGAN
MQIIHVTQPSYTGNQTQSFKMSLYCL